MTHKSFHTMVMLHADEKRQIDYDIFAGEYWQFDKQKDNSSKSGNWWLLIQPFAIAGIELVNHYLMRYQEVVRKPAAFIIYILLAMAGTLAWEACLSSLMDKAIRSGRQIPEPDRETLQVWARDIPGRLRKIALISVVAALIIFALCCLFSRTGIPLFMTLALAAYLIAYFIIASAEPFETLHYWMTIGKELQ